MKKIMAIVLFLICFFTIEGKDFDEFKFMKKVNPNITQRTMQIIKAQVDKNYHTVSGAVTKRQVYFIIAQESRFNPNAISPNREDRGLFQVNRITYLHMVDKGILSSNNWSHIYDIEYNSRVGFKIIKMKAQKVRNMFKPETHKDWSLMTLIAYNKGAGNLKLDIERGRLDFHNFKYIQQLYRFKQYI